MTTKRTPSGRFDQNVDAARIIQMYCNEGRSAEAIATALGCSRTTVSRHLHSAGISMGRSGQHRMINDEYVALTLKMRAEGLDWETIAHRIGFSSSALQRAVRQHALSASMAREAALQERLNLADQRIDELEAELHQLRAQRKAA